MEAGASLCLRGRPGHVDRGLGSLHSPSGLTASASRVIGGPPASWTWRTLSPPRAPHARDPPSLQHTHLPSAPCPHPPSDLGRALWEPPRPMTLMPSWLLSPLGG